MKHRRSPRQNEQAALFGSARGRQRQTCGRQAQAVHAAAAVQDAAAKPNKAGKPGPPASDYAFCSTFADVHALMHERATRVLANSAGHRCSIGVVGAPGSGKTTAASALADRCGVAPLFTLAWMRLRRVICQLLRGPESAYEFHAAMCGHIPADLRKLPPPPPSGGHTALLLPCTPSAEDCKARMQPELRRRAASRLHLRSAQGHCHRGAHGWLPLLPQ